MEFVSKERQDDDLKVMQKKRHLSDSNTRGQSPTAVLIAGDPVNHSGKVTSWRKVRSVIDVDRVEIVELNNLPHVIFIGF
ncbi:hypothetical protein OG21DRAFT_492360 [Imleria badia]|nr:hypothetical protein OG21DRAFT_492360 [Imleria badia]